MLIKIANKSPPPAPYRTLFWWGNEEDVQAAEMTHIGATRYEFAMMLLGLLAHGWGARVDERQSAISANPSAILLHLFIALGKQHTKDTLPSERRSGLKGDDYLAFHKETERAS